MPAFQAVAARLARDAVPRLILFRGRRVANCTPSGIPTWVPTCALQALHAWPTYLATERVDAEARPRALPAYRIASFCNSFTTSLDILVDYLVCRAGIEGVADARPDQFSVASPNRVHIGFDAHGRVFAQVVGRVNHWVYRTIVPVKGPVVWIGNVGLPRNVGDSLIDFEQSRDNDRINLETL